MTAKTQTQNILIITLALLLATSLGGQYFIGHFLGNKDGIIENPKAVWGFTLGDGVLGFLLFFCIRNRMGLPSVFERLSSHLRSRTTWMSSNAPFLFNKPPHDTVRSGWFFAISIMCACYWWVHQHIVLDDAFIYFRVVAIFLKTGKPEFNIGDNISVATSPLWMLLLAGMKSIFPFLEIVVIAKACWMFLMLVASYLAYRIFAIFIGMPAIFIGMPFFLSPYLGNLVGNEIALVYTALFLTWWGMLCRKPVYAGFGFGIGYLARGEFIVLALPIALYWLYTAKINSQLLWKKPLLKFFLIALLIALCWHVYYWAAFGEIFPKTLHVKIIQGQSGDWKQYHHKLGVYIHRFLSGPLPLRFSLLFLLLGVGWRPFPALFIGMYTALHAAIYTGLKVSSYPWYYYDLYLMIVLCILMGMAAMLKYIRQPLLRFVTQPLFRRMFAHSLPYTAFVLLLFSMFPLEIQTFLPSRFLPPSSIQDERYQSYMALCRKLKAYLHPGDRILSPEVGIIGYYFLDYEIRDNNGLASPNVNLSNIMITHILWIIINRMLLFFHGGIKGLK
ncbi:MAG: hypothetical protein GY801_31635 [bacterium]|nr:hypothetical protein [bacterium]